MVNRIFGECRNFQQHTFGGMDERYFFAVCESFCRQDVMGGEWQEYVAGTAIRSSACTAVENMHIQFIAFLGRDTPRLLRYASALCPVYCLPVFFEPSANCLKALYSFLWQCPVGPRAYVQEQIRSLACRPDKISDEKFCGFIVLVSYPVAPGAVHGLACFQRKARDVLA